MNKRLVMAMLGLGMLLACTVSLWEAFDDVAKRSGTSVHGLAQTDSIKDSDLLYVVQTQKVPDGPGSVYEMDHRMPADPPLRGDPKARDHETYDNVINQFAVETNLRYRHDDNVINQSAVEESTVTYCHTFVWDVTRATEAVIPFWLGKDGEPTEPWLTHEGWRMAFQPTWLSANDMNQWLNREGLRYGWREVTAEKAQELANLGHPTVASVHEPHRVGHMGIVRPGEVSNGPALAQAGTQNVNYAHVYDFFPPEGTQFFVNDTGTVVDLP